MFAVAAKKIVDNNRPFSTRCFLNVTCCSIPTSGSLAGVCVCVCWPSSEASTNLHRSSAGMCDGAGDNGGTLYDSLQGQALAC